MYLKKLPMLTILEAFLSLGRWQDFYQQNAQLKVRNLSTNLDFGIYFLCGLGLCVQLGNIYSLAYLNSIEGAGESLAENDRLFSR